MSVYLELFHGRDTLEEDMDDWGYQGPTLGPFDFVHTTYADTVYCGCWGGVNETWLQVHDGCLEYERKYYGDWSVYSATGSGSVRT